MRHPGSTLLFVALALTSGCTKRGGNGVVVEVRGEDGLPLADAQVEAQERVLRAPRFLPGMLQCPAEVILLSTGTSDAEGRAELTGLPAGQSYELSVRPAESSWPLVRVAGGSASVLVGPARTVTGSLLWQKTEECSNQPRIFALDAFAKSFPSVCAVGTPAQLREDGRFELSGLGPTSYLIRAEHCGRLAETMVDATKPPEGLSLDVRGEQPPAATPPNGG